MYIKRARVVNADSIQTNVDIYIEDGKIKFIGTTGDLQCPGGVRVIDVAGMFKIVFNLPFIISYSHIVFIT